MTAAAAPTRKRAGDPVPPPQEREVPVESKLKRARDEAFEATILESGTPLWAREVVLGPVPDGIQLGQAVQENDLAQVQLLLARGADANAFTDSLEHPILIACAAGNIEMVRALISYGADVNVTNFLGDALIQVAVEDGNLPMAKLLCASGAVLDVTDLAGDTPLHTACIIGELAMAKLLLEHGATGDIKNNGGNTPLFLAVEGEHEDIVEALCMAVVDVNCPVSKGTTPLHEACLNGYLKIAELLLRFGAKPAQQNEAGETPLHIAIRRAERPIVELLCKEGSALDIQDNSGDTPLYEAIYFELYDMATLLLDHGASPQIVRADGLTAAYLGHCRRLPPLLLARLPLSADDNRLVSTSILAQVFSCSGTMAQGEKTIKLEGAYATWFHRLFAEALADLEQVGHVEELTKAFSDSLDHDPAQIAAKVQRKELTIVEAGWNRHAVSLCFFDGYMAICNRGEGSDVYSSIEVFQIDSSLVTQEIIQEITGYGRAQSDVAQSYFYEVLPKKLNGGEIGEDLFSLEFEEIANQAQKAGNCSVASVVAALRFALGVLTLNADTTGDFAAVFAAAKAESKGVSAYLTQYAWKRHSSNTLPGFYNVDGVADRINTKMKKIDPFWIDIVGENEAGQILVAPFQGGGDVRTD